MFKGLLEKFLDLIYKKRCVICSCSKANDLLCKTCSKDIIFLSTFPHRIYNSITIYSATVYTSVIKKLIQLFKFQHKRNISKVLADLLFQYFKKLNLNNKYIVIYPNSFYFKNMTRGYEHMYLIAKEFCKLSDFKLLKNAICKTKNTIPQYKAKNRFKNVSGVFKINKKYIKELKENPILLIDDIITSGATIEEIINILNKEKIKNITVLTISKAVKS